MRLRRPRFAPPPGRDGLIRREAIAGELPPAGSASRAFVQRIVSAFVPPPPRAAGPLAPGQPAVASEPLTDREREVLSLLAEGVSNRDIGGAIFISENTVKYHLKNIYSKLAVTGRVQAIEATRRMGVIA